MADEQVTQSENTTEPEAQATPPAADTQAGAAPTQASEQASSSAASNDTPAAPAEAPKAAETSETAAASETKPAAPATPATPAPAPAAPKPHAPSPLAFAKKPAGKKHPVAAPKTPTYSDADIKQAESFGRVDEKGAVYVRDAEGEREVGEFPGATNEEALTLYARRYLDLKAKLDLFATRLKAANIKAHEIDESIKTLAEETAQPAVVGDIAALKKQYEELKAAGETKKTELAEARKEALAKAIKERTAIVEKAEALAAGLGDNTNWRSTADKFRSLFDQWQQHQRTTIRIDKPTADALWKRFSAARTTFNQHRRKWAQARDASRAETKRLKEEIISEANEIKDSTDWGATSHQFNELMDRWKAAGRAGRKEDDELWARFREACDVFFNARQADRDQMSSNEKENLAKKEELLKKAEALVPVADEKAAKKARQALANIQDEWDQIGYVPREDMHRIESRLDAVDNKIKAVEEAAWKKSDPEADARVSSFENQLKAQLDELDAKIAAESDPAKKSKLEAEKATKEQWLNAVK
ncbi:DUF349 domain-containing protein [Bifidobacterium sp. ESL0790]|uniref:DUF349 domain-containing protein n=1 Tax=Bifidobacterium sp. ESL0790 TaxID=2983233 RepID=UPI0023F8AA92|nr:DUF349 domain-containing protein [Bifidobacterium sp. ESL0790]WEV71849.1 DUF349 domain-containing protein [Bifidobacterium sp. ESL0790]